MQKLYNCWCECHVRLCARFGWTGPLTSHPIHGNCVENSWQVQWGDLHCFIGHSLSQYRCTGEHTNYYIQNLTFWDTLQKTRLLGHFRYCLQVLFRPVYRQKSQSKNCKKCTKTFGFGQDTSSFKPKFQKKWGKKKYLKLFWLLRPPPLIWNIPKLKQEQNNLTSSLSCASLTSS